MTTFVAPPRTPSPKVRIRSQSFDSPSSRVSVTPIDESPYSKSTGSIVCKPLPRHDILQAAQHGQGQAVNVLLPLHTKMSDESILSESSSAASSVASSPTSSEIDMDPGPDSPLLAARSERQRPHPLAFCQSVASDADDKQQPSSPFMYQDRSVPMHSPWLVRAVLDLYDVRGLDWMSIAEPIERVCGVRTNSAEVLDILSDNGRVLRRWWD